MSHHGCHEDNCHHHHHSCGDESTGSPHHHHCDCECHQHSCKYSEKLLEIADEAWMEVIKEEIKKEILQQSGKHISEIAKLVASSNHERWTYKLDEKKNQENYEEKLRNLMLCKKS